MNVQDETSCLNSHWFTVSHAHTSPTYTQGMLVKWPHKFTGCRTGTIFYCEGKKGIPFASKPSPIPGGALNPLGQQRKGKGKRGARGIPLRNINLGPKRGYPEHPLYTSASLIGGQPPLHTSYMKQGSNSPYTNTNSPWKPTKSSQSSRQGPNRYRINLASL
jgi:hypothetical protein